MPRKCSICCHPQREEIDKQLLCRVSYRDIARQFGVSKDALGRHHESHISEVLAKAHGVKEEVRADSILQEVKDLKAKALSLLEKAEKSGDLKTALQGIRETRGCLELMARVLGEIRGQDINLSTTVSLDIYSSPQWIEVGRALAELLGPYPELKRLVGERLLELTKGER